MPYFCWLSGKSWCQISKKWMYRVDQWSKLILQLNAHFSNPILKVVYSIQSLSKFYILDIEYVNGVNLTEQSPSLEFCQSFEQKQLRITTGSRSFQRDTVSLCLSRSFSLSNSPHLHKAYLLSMQSFDHECML